jgi:hypothetical protein
MTQGLSAVEAEAEVRGYVTEKHGKSCVMNNILWGYFTNSNAVHDWLVG